MFPTKGYKVYKQHWEDQASFMDKPPWDKDKILKLTVATDFDDNLKELQFSNHSLKKENSKLTVCLLYTSPSPRDATLSRMPSSA